MEYATPQPQSSKMKHYYKNKENILSYYHAYYQLNKEKIKQQRRDRYASQRAQRTANDFVENIGLQTISTEEIATMRNDMNA